MSSGHGKIQRALAAILEKRPRLTTAEAAAEIYASKQPTNAQLVAVRRARAKLDQEGVIRRHPRSLAHRAYYNEIDPYAAEWLRNLIKAGLIAPGDVDERSIVEIQPSDLQGYTQCHFFAGIGGWSYALRLAHWSDAEPVWTGSCPCQPLSSAGQRQGHLDERHLWPAFYELIAQCRPATVFGEQVASADGREWLTAVRVDVEDLGYACGIGDLPAAGIGAPHIRQRLFWVADTASARRCGRQQMEDGRRRQPGRSSPTGRLADAECHTNDTRRTANKPNESSRTSSARASIELGRRGVSGNFWAELEWLPCQDGTSKATQPGLFPLADGLPHTVAQLRAFGNAILPPLAAQFIIAARASQADILADEQRGTDGVR